MDKEYKINAVRKAFEDFANAHIGQEMTTRQINDGVSDMVDGGLGGLCASDFALPETQRKMRILKQKAVSRSASISLFDIGSR